MPNTIVVDDSRNGTTSAEKPAIFYAPADQWYANRICNGCFVNGTEAFSRLSGTAVQGTWTITWWSITEPLLTASMEFQGTGIEAYFILFHRSQDTGDAGESDLRFYVDQQLIKQMPTMSPEAYKFQDDFTSRLCLFQHSGLDPKVPHHFQIQWTHNGTRPRVAVALDTIEIQQDASSSSSLPLPSPTPSPEARSKTNIGPIIGAIVGCLVLILALILGVWIWRRRKNRRQTTPSMVEHPFTGIEAPQAPPCSDINPFESGTVSAYSPSTTHGSSRTGPPPGLGYPVYPTVRKGSANSGASNATSPTIGDSSSSQLGQSSAPGLPNTAPDDEALPPPYYDTTDNPSGSTLNISQPTRQPGGAEKSRRRLFTS